MNNQMKRSFLSKLSLSSSLLLLLHSLVLSTCLLNHLVVVVGVLPVVQQVDAFVHVVGRIPSSSSIRRSSSSSRKTNRYIRHQQSKPSTTILLQASQYHPVVIVGNDYQTTMEATVGATLALATLEYLTTGKTTQTQTTDDVPPQTPSPQLVTCMTMSSSSSSNFEQQQQMSNEYKAFLQDAIQYYPSSFPQSNGNLFDFMTNYMRVISNEYNNNVIKAPMIHGILQPGFDVRPFLNTSFRNSLSSLGLHVTLPPSPPSPSSQGNDHVVVSREISKEIGTMIQKFIDISKNPNQEDLILTWDLKLHLSMLLSNSLPKSLPASSSSETTSAQKDSFLIMEEQGGQQPLQQQQGTTTTTILVNYLYDYQKLGGTDPLLSQTKEYVLTSPTTTTTATTTGLVSHYSHSHSSYAQAAAYSALRGNGLDSIQSSCLAVSIGSMLLLDETMNNNNNSRLLLSPAPYNWSTIEQIVRYSQQVYNTMMIKEPSNTNSIIRQKYKDYGYR